MQGMKCRLPPVGTPEAQAGGQSVSRVRRPAGPSVHAHKPTYLTICGGARGACSTPFLHAKRGVGCGVWCVVQWCGRTKQHRYTSQRLGSLPASHRTVTTYVRTAGGWWWAWRAPVDRFWRAHSISTSPHLSPLTSLTSLTSHTVVVSRSLAQCLVSVLFLKCASVGRSVGRSVCVWLCRLVFFGCRRCWMGWGGLGWVWSGLASFRAMMMR
ncbi:uncharacterized protein IWZ02DRAFT_228602 [Phyllosticta citriasiana]|uniref:uncharacterized protein n=1 Tax=Phyllosticta citriasiana TaxID=595635 RepID=UPI0030FDBE07